jgi:hypothetical protein
MKFIQFTPVAYQVGSVTALFIVALDNEGELWWMDTNLPEPAWKPLPTHPHWRPRSGRKRTG